MLPILPENDNEPLTIELSSSKNNIIKAPILSKISALKILYQLTELVEMDMDPMSIHN